MFVLEICLVGGEGNPRFKEERVIYEGDSVIDMEEQIALHANEVDYDDDKYFMITVNNECVQRCFGSMSDYYKYVLISL